MTKPRIDARDFPGDSDERLNFALNLKEGLTPHAVIDDWGDFEKDYPNTAIEADTESQVRDSDGMGYSTTEEVQAYYDTLVSEDIKIIDRE